MEIQNKCILHECINYSNLLANEFDFVLSSQLQPVVKIYLGWLWQFALLWIVCSISTNAWIELRWHLKGCDVFDDLQRLILCFSIFHISVTTPHPNRKPPTLRRWLLQIHFVTVDNVNLVNATQFLCFLLWQVKYIPEYQLYYLLKWVSVQKNEQKIIIFQKSWLAETILGKDHPKNFNFAVCSV